MIAVRGYQIIIRPCGGDCTANDRFLPDVKMTEAADLLRLILLARPLLKTPNEQHQREHLDLVALLRLRHKAGLDRARLASGRAARIGGATPMKAENEKPGEEQIAQDRGTEKHPARRGAVLRQTDGKRLNESGKILQVTGIAQPGERVRNDVKQNRAGERRGQKRHPRRTVGESEAEQPDDDQGEVTATDQWIEERRAVVNVEDDVGNEKGDERHGEFVARRKISRAAEGNGSHGRKVREPGCAGSNGQAGYDAVRDGGDDEKECGNHRSNSNVPE